MERTRALLKTGKGSQMKKERSATVEPTFGKIKQNGRFNQFLLRGTEKAAIEFIFMCIAVNMAVNVFTGIIASLQILPRDQ